MKLSFIVLVFLPFLSSGQVISTLAGNGSTGYSGDGVAATSAELHNPVGIFKDGVGNIYIADYQNSRIRKVDAAGIITTIAGNGTAGYGGDGIPATSAELNSPTNVFVDSIGDVLISDYLNNRIRKVNTSGIISTIAGTGTAGFSGDGGPAGAAEFNGPEAIFGDAGGNLFISDAHNQRIRKIDISGTINTIAGNGTGGFSGDGVPATSTELNDPYGIFTDRTGNVYFADQDNNRIRKINTLGFISTIAGTGIAGYSGDGGTATAAELNAPEDIFSDATGNNFFFTDRVNNCIRRINTSGIISTIAGTSVAGFSGDGGMATAAELNWPECLFVDSSGSIYFSDYNNNRIRMISNCSNYITHQPVHDTIPEGHNAVYTVTTTMPSPLYQWQEDAGAGFINLANVLPYTGVNTNTLTIDDATILFNASHYRCVITSASSAYCADTSSSAILIIHSGAGIGQLSSSDISVFPNPAGDHVVIQLPGKIDDTYLQLVNTVGQILALQKVNSNKTSIFLENLPTGMYILKLQCGNEVFNKKIFKN